MYTLEEYLDERHRSPCGMWLNALAADVKKAQAFWDDYQRRRRGK